MTLRWKIAQSLEWRWWKRYLSGKNKEEYLSWKRDYWQHILTLLPIQKHTQHTEVLDLGCGPAGIFIALPQAYVTAVDPLLDMYEKNLPSFKKSDYPNTTFVNSSIENFSPERAYTMVFCMNCLNHVSDLESATRVIATCITKNGSLILSIDAHKYSLLKHLFRILPGDVLHPHQLGLDDYIHLLKLNGIKTLNTTLVKSGKVFDHYLILGEKE